MTEELIAEQLIRLDVSGLKSSTDVIDTIAEIIGRCDHNVDLEALRSAFLAREQQSSTGFRGGVAIPHCKTDAISSPAVVFLRLTEEIDFGGPDGPADLILAIATPASGGKAHLKILSRLARKFIDAEFLRSLRTVPDPPSAVRVLRTALASNPAAAHHERLTILAVTSCPTGIAHTYMAADALKEAARKRSDLNLIVEAQGASSVEPIPEEIASTADSVIFATEVAVRNEERFHGLPVVRTGVKRAIDTPNELLDHAVAAAHSPHPARVTAKGASQSSGGVQSPELLNSIRRAIMTGVSYMVPFVAAGGLLLALGFAVGGYDVGMVYQAVLAHHSLSTLPGHEIVTPEGMLSTTKSGLGLYLGSVFYATGQAAMSLVVAALSGYIAFAMAGRPGIAPGFIGGVISVTLGAGFLGGLVTGIIAGTVAYGLTRLRAPHWISSIMPVVVIPLLTSAVVGLAMFLLLGVPLARVLAAMEHWLSTLDGVSSITIGALLGLMMCSDLGGPINKSVYLFATAGLSTQEPSSLAIMATVMASGMVPPLALSLATAMRGQLFTPAERDNGKSAWLMGLSFVSEGAIPFAAADPICVLPSLMAGGALTGALCMLLDVRSSAPHGGIFVIFAIQPVWGFLVAILAGTVVSALLVIALKQFVQPVVSKRNSAELYRKEPYFS
ncbi:PTS fructose transporter subunit IIABC [Corynebacterium epidermidicanis]|uniref:Fructose specific PTS system component n=1 Tax=Corynebacterium epidermidicanis TaxID=1050174 RepID=A0A0G3GWV4_9CORY|nr:fructose-specific PTS transporter subunit EIIC [Corynebacterium epidermidicanis]AKK03332.1 fructose specific PTS system component [Corynebacterium epidermidicanis]